MTPEDDLADLIVRHALELQRLSAYEEQRAIAILRDLEGELRALLNTRTLSSASRREINALLKEAHKAIAGRYTNIAGILDVEALTEHVAARTVDAMNAAFPNLAFGPPSVETLRSLARNVLIEGAPSAAWWAKQSDDAAFRFAATVRAGVINGNTNEQIVRKVVEDMDVSRRNARSLVHSSIMTAANQARLGTFRKASRYAEGVRWLATLDSHTCKTCAALDGSQWDFDGQPLNGTKLDFQAPPKHFACRCVISLIPSLQALDEAFPGIGGKIRALRDRATAQGPQKLTMTQWLKRNPVAAEEVLGATRVKRFLAGELTLTDLVTKSGRPLSLAEL